MFSQFFGLPVTQESAELPARIRTGKFITKTRHCCSTAAYCFLPNHCALVRRFVGRHWGWY